MWRRKRTWASVFLLSILGLLVSCSSTRVMLQTASNKPKGDPAQPPITATTLDQWEYDTRGIRFHFRASVYGPIPDDLDLVEQDRQTIPGTHFGDTARIETRQYNIVHEPYRGSQHSFGLVLVTPARQEGPVPIIMMQNFCPNHDVVPHPDIPIPPTVTFSCSGDGMMSHVFTYLFGRYITTPPIKEIMERGYALAVMYPSEFIPDRAVAGQAVLDDLFAEQPDQIVRTGALAAWASQFSMVSGMLDTDPRFNKTIAYGHSRYGKTALIAAAFDPNIDAVIAHQSGTGGASLTRNKPGETLEDIVEGYPHWFNGIYATYAGRESELPVDQHQLLALIAPRPVLLGNAKRDVWSDPNGAFRAAQAADKVYELYGKDGLTTSRLNQFDPNAELSFWIRPGTHGVVKEDWPAFLEFLDAHLK